RFAPNLPQALAGALDNAKQALVDYLRSVTLESMLESVEQFTAQGNVANQPAGHCRTGERI
ncbi:MAG: hypothetical protein R2855_02480, partial [Thermomicrobiales bacterium]